MQGIMRHPLHQDAVTVQRVKQRIVCVVSPSTGAPFRVLTLVVRNIKGVKLVDHRHGRVSGREVGRRLSLSN